MCSVPNPRMTANSVARHGQPRHIHRAFSRYASVSPCVAAHRITLNDEDGQAMKKWSTTAVALAAMAIGPALAEPPAPAPTKVEVRYDVSLLGMSVGSMQLRLTLDNGAYRAEVYVQPEGLAATFAPNTINGATTGRTDGGRALPDHSWVQQSKSGSVRTVQISYAGGTPVSINADPPYTVRPFTPTEADWQGTVDPISALVSTFLMPTIADEASACGTPIAVYDGRRRYDFDPWFGGRKQVKKGAGGYRGEVIYCVDTYRRIAGWRPDRIGPKYDTKIHAWYAAVGSAAGVTPFYLPVRLWGESEVGDVVAVPTSVTIDGKPWTEVLGDG